MNERIKELIEQATEHDYKTYDSFNQKELLHNKFNKEKFAELLVRECADVAKRFHKNNKEYDAGLAIEQHFGVE